MFVKRFLWNVLIGIDQLGNTLLGGAPDETISARAGRGKDKHWYWRWTAKVLNKLEPGHTNHAIQAEVNHTQLPPEYKGK